MFELWRDSKFFTLFFNFEKPTDYYEYIMIKGMYSYILGMGIHNIYQATEYNFIEAII